MVLATTTSAATPPRAFFRTRQHPFNPLFFSLAGSPRTFPPHCALPAATASAAV